MAEAAAAEGEADSPPSERNLRGRVGDKTSPKKKEEPEDEGEKKCELCSKTLSITASDRKYVASANGYPPVLNLCLR